jgi:hypothetical protein
MACDITANGSEEEAIMRELEQEQAQMQNASKQTERQRLKALRQEHVESASSDLESGMDDSTLVHSMCSLKIPGSSIQDEEEEDETKALVRLEKIRVRQNAAMQKLEAEKQAAVSRLLRKQVSRRGAAETAAVYAGSIFF